MDRFIVNGGKRLRGRVVISGSKNAALPILIATLLTDDRCEIKNVPDLRDIRTTLRLIEHLGKGVERRGSTVIVTYRRRLKTWAPYELVKQMRASTLVAGPLLARFKHVRVALPGGCAIGLRPIDIHLTSFQKMGARLSHIHGDVVLNAGRLRASNITLRFPSVGATENLMMAAATIPATTIIRHAAREPEIVDLADFLVRMGAIITGAGTPVIKIRGQQRLSGAVHTVIPDRIETGTFLLAGAACGGDLKLQGGRADHLSVVIDDMKRAGASVTSYPGGLRVVSKKRPKPVSISTRPYPGFPTDLQAPWMAWMCLARGQSRIKENLFEKRFIHAAELGRMGARIAISGNSAAIDGVESLYGAPIMASDIRAGAALIVAALAAKGKTEIQRVYHIDRGYERVERKLRAAGAVIRRVN